MASWMRRLAVIVSVGAACGSEDEFDPNDVSADYPDLPLARGGIVLDRVTFNQGVEIPMFDAGEPVDPADRNAKIIANRMGMVRAYWVLPPEWEAREITARLTIHQDGEEPIFRDETMFVETDATPHFVDSAFWWILPPEMVHSATHFEVSLLEVDEDLAKAPLYEPVPLIEPTPMDAAPGPRTMDVLVVPFDHQLEGEDGCLGPPEFDEERRKRWEEHLFSFNPLESIRLEIREPIVWDQTMAEFGPLLSELRILREADGAPPWQYYFGALDPCDGGATEGWAGLGSRPEETTKEQAHRRVSVGVVRQNVLATMETFVHEIGHNQERTHVLCAGNENNVDETYPYEDGATGVYGFDIVNWVHEPPSVAEYMTYCGPTWVSDHGWNQVMPVIETLSSWEAEEAEGDELSEVVIGTLHPSGAERWWTSRGSVILERAEEAVEVWGTEGLLDVLPANTTWLEDGTLEFVLPLPERFDEATELRIAARAIDVARSEIRDVSAVRAFRAR